MLNTPVKIFSGTATRYLSEKICNSYGIQLGASKVDRFSDGEFEPYFKETVRGSYLFIIQSTYAPAENLLELLFMIDAAKRASAYKIVAVMPYFGFARQDRKDKPRVSIGAKMIANLLTAAGVSRVITMDLHADQIQGFFDVPVDHLYSSSIFLPYVKNMGLENLVIASPDTGGSKRANNYAKFLDKELVICHKTRKRANEVDNITVIGDVRDKNVILIDDMIDTAGTITKAADRIMEMGAISVRVLASHGVERSALQEVIITDSIPQKQECSKIKVLSIADMFADVIKKVHSHQSISSNFLI